MEPLYRDLTSGQEVVESQLGESFAEYLNAEVALRNIADMEGAKRWLYGTFLYVRVPPCSLPPEITALSDTHLLVNVNKATLDTGIMCMLHLASNFYMQPSRRRTRTSLLALCKTCVQASACL